MPARRVLTVGWRCVPPVAGGRPIVGYAVTASTGYRPLLGARSCAPAVGPGFAGNRGLLLHVRNVPAGPGAGACSPPRGGAVRRLSRIRDSTLAVGLGR